MLFTMSPLLGSELRLGLSRSFRVLHDSREVNAAAVL